MGELPPRPNPRERFSARLPGRKSAGLAAGCIPFVFIATLPLVGAAGEGGQKPGGGEGVQGAGCCRGGRARGRSPQQSGGVGFSQVRPAWGEGGMG